MATPTDTSHGLARHAMAYVLAGDHGVQWFTPGELSDSATRHFCGMGPQQPRRPAPCAAAGLTSQNEDWYRPGQWSYVSP